MSLYGTRSRRLSVQALLGLMGFVCLSGIQGIGSALDEEMPPETGSNNRPIILSADDTSWDLTNSLITLTGNVKIIQDRTVISADKVQIFTTKNVKAGPTLNPDSVKKFIANGNVGIELETGVATSEKAVYFRETKILEISGTPAKYVSRDDTMAATITGSTITMDREAGDKFEANGDVKIEFEMGVAASESAIYSPETKTLVLLGTPAKIVGGDDTMTGTITGSMITVNRETSMINVEKMEAVIFPEDNP